jgi:hypothetical protein
MLNFITSYEKTSYFNPLFHLLFSLCLGGLQRQDELLNNKSERDLVGRCTKLQRAATNADSAIYFQKCLEKTTAEHLKNTDYLTFIYTA